MWNGGSRDTRLTGRGPSVLTLQRGKGGSGAMNASDSGVRVSVYSHSQNGSPFRVLRITLFGGI